MQCSVKSSAILDWIADHHIQKSQNGSCMDNAENPKYPPVLFKTSDVIIEYEERLPFLENLFHTFSIPEILYALNILLCMLQCMQI